MEFKEAYIPVGIVDEDIGQFSLPLVATIKLATSVVYRSTHPCRCLLANDMVGEEETNC